MLRTLITLLCLTPTLALAQEAAGDAAADGGGFVFSWDNVVRVVQEEGTAFGLKFLGAIALWVVGRWLIKFALGLADKAMKSRVDETLRRYLSSSLQVLLTFALIVAILGFFGVETTTFAALLAGAGLAIGTAWGGLLTNFAAGVFIMALKPYKVGDFISAGGIIGTVKEIGLFVTVVDTMDNVQTIVGNNKIFSDNIQNFTANDYRRVDLVAQLAHEADHADAIRLLKEAIAKIDNVRTDPGVDVEVLEFNLAGPVLAVRPYVHNDHYWQVYFDTNKAIRETLGAAGYPVPWQQYQIQKGAA